MHNYNTIVMVVASKVLLRKH